MSKVSALKKPTLSTDAVLAFAEGATSGQKPTARGGVGASGEKGAKAAKSGLVPAGDIRLTANIREDLHLKLKIRAAQERTTVGELIERWVEGWQA